jgi:hypothetical protein
MRRYLSYSEALSAVRNGRAVEQLLRIRFDGDDRIIERLRIHRERVDEFCVAHITAFDEGSVDFIDIGEFQSCDPDVPFGERSSFSDPGDALAFAVEELGALPERFVNSGMAQAEYDDFIAEHGYLQRP